MLFIIVALLLSANALAQDANCDFYQNVQAGGLYFIRSPNYPNSYPRGVQCRWIGQCPSGYRCRLDCLIELPQTQGCSGDRVLISRTGDQNLNNAETYCGRQTFTVLSNDRSISIGLIVASNSNGGRFTCNLTAQAVPPPQQQCICGIRKQNRIVGGTVTGVNEYTVAAAIVDARERTVFCGGTILNNRHVLTAAHCMIDRSPSSAYISVGNANFREGTTFNVLRIRTHPYFNPDTFDYDIAVIELASNITFNTNVTPVCLAFRYQNANLDGVTMTLLGWGTTSFGGPTSTNLRQVDVNITRQASCQSQRPSVTSRQLCTQTPGKDSCQNDSGGPGLVQSAATGRLFPVGIVSYGDGCGSAGLPAVYTRVNEFLNWITTNAPGDYCVSE